MGKYPDVNNCPRTPKIIDLLRIVHTKCAPISRWSHLDGVCTSMSFGCSFSAIPNTSSISCGSTRGRTEVVFLLECRDDISPHLKACHLSRSGLEEYEVILASGRHFRHSQGKVEGSAGLPPPPLRPWPFLEASSILSASSTHRVLKENKEPRSDWSFPCERNTSDIWLYRSHRIT